MLGGGTNQKLNQWFYYKNCRFICIVFINNVFLFHKKKHENTETHVGHIQIRTYTVHTYKNDIIHKIEARNQ